MVAFPLSGLAKWPYCSVLYTVRASIDTKEERVCLRIFQRGPQQSIQFFILAPLPTAFYTDFRGFLSLSVTEILPITL